MEKKDKDFRGFSKGELIDCIKEMEKEWKVQKEQLEMEKHKRMSLGRIGMYAIPVMILFTIAWKGLSWFAKNENMHPYYATMESMGYGYNEYDSTSADFIFARDWDTRNTAKLALDILKDLQCTNLEVDTQSWGKRISFKYDNNLMLIDIPDGSVNINLVDLYWTWFDRGNPKELVSLWENINNYNKNFDFKVSYTIDGDRNCIYSRRDMLLIKEIPNINAYMEAAIKNMLWCHEDFIKDVKDYSKSFDKNTY